MEVLKQLFSDKEIGNLLEANPYIEYKSDKELGSVIKVLSDIQCTNKILRNIITTNSFVLLRDSEDVKELLNKLSDYGIKKIIDIINSYPYILLKNAYEIDGYFIKCHKNGISIEKAISMLEENPYIIDKE